MGSTNDFVIENGVLKKYTGPGGDVVIPDGVTSIGTNAFRGCKGLASVAFPDSLISIGDLAFGNCENLSSVTIPDGVTSIGTNAFRGCKGLASVAFPDSLISIGDWAFGDCENLSSVTIPDNVTSIGDYAFDGCAGLTSVTIQNSETSIGGASFASCENLSVLSIPEDLTDIGAAAFKGCRGLCDPAGMVIVKGILFDCYAPGNTLEVPEGVSCIGWGAFEHCSGMEYISFPKTIKKVEEPFGWRTTKPKSFRVDCLETWCQIDFTKSILGLDSDLMVNGSLLNDLVIPQGVNRIGNRAFAGCDSLRTVSVPESVKCIGDGAFQGCGSLQSVAFSSGLESIGDRAFAGCKSLCGIAVPEGLKHIGSYSFTDCDSLTMISLPKSLKTIGKAPLPRNCTEIRISDLEAWCGLKLETSNTRSGFSESPGPIQKIGLNDCAKLLLNGEPIIEAILPPGMTRIEPFSFYGCESLERISIPESIRFIGREAFYGCKNLKEVHISSIESWCRIEQESAALVMGSFSFDKSPQLLLDGKPLTVADIPKGITSISNYLFYGCRDLGKVTIPDSVTSIGKDAFYGCVNLRSISIPDSVTSIGDRAFWGCDGLTSVTIPDSVTSIGYSAFWGCDGLTSVTIPNSVTSIGTEAFGRCESLKSILIPNSVTSIGNSVFWNCDRLTSVTIPDSVTSIGDSAFSGCSGLTSVTIPDSVTSIGTAAFGSCESLRSILIPDSVTSIGDSAFSGCSGLTSVMIPDSVTSIGREAFQGCEKLQSINLPGGLSSIGADVFKDCGSLTNLSLSQGFMEMVSQWKDAQFKEIILQKDFWRGIGATQQSEFYLNRQGKTLTPGYSTVITPEIAEQMGGEMLTAVERTIGTKQINAAAGFIASYYSVLSKNMLTKLYDALKNKKKAEKAFATINSIPEIKAIMEKANQQDSGETASSGTVEGIVMEVIRKENNTVRGIEARLKEFYSLSVSELPAVMTKKGSRVEPFVLAWMLTAHEEQEEEYGYGNKNRIREIVAEYPSGLRPEVAETVALLENRSLQDALLDLADRFLAKYVNTKKKYLTFPICRYADEGTMTEMTKRAPSWSTSVSGKDAPPLHEFRSAVCCSDTRAAMLFSERYKELERFARAHGTDADTIRDRYLSDVGLDAQGGKNYDLGNQTVVARLQKDMSFLFELPDGKTAKTLPKKGADPEKYKLASADYSEMKKSVKKILKTRVDVLFDDFLNGRARRSADWQTSYMCNPLLREAASLLVWAQGKQTFTLAANGPIDSSGKPYMISEKGIKVAHPMEMESSEVKAWQQYFASNGLKQPFAQIWEPVIDPELVKRDRYVGCMIPYYRFTGQGKHGITVYDNNFHNEIEIYFADCTATVDRIDWERHNITPQHRFEIKQFAVNQYTRRSNHIVAYLDRVTVWDRVQKDDVKVMETMGSFTFAQISDFIKTAQEANAVNVLALLMDYNKKHFGDFDPMNEFTLEW